MSAIMQSVFLWAWFLEISCFAVLHGFAVQYTLEKATERNPAGPLKTENIVSKYAKMRTCNDMCSSVVYVYKCIYIYIYVYTYLYTVSYRLCAKMSKRLDFASALLHRPRGGQPGGGRAIFPGIGGLVRMSPSQFGAAFDSF